MFKKVLAALPVLSVMVFYAGLATAGTGGTEFTAIYDTVIGWTQGFLGKTIAIAMFLTGIAMGIVRQSLMAIALGIGGAMGIYYTPDIIDGIVSALM
jgi:conjugal transfer pilus assembly protein TraA